MSTPLVPLNQQRPNLQALAGKQNRLYEQAASWSAETGPTQLSVLGALFSAGELHFSKLAHLTDDVSVNRIAFNPGVSVPPGAGAPDPWVGAALYEMIFDGTGECLPPAPMPPAAAQLGGGKLRLIAGDWVDNSANSDAYAVATVAIPSMTLDRRRAYCVGVVHNEPAPGSYSVPCLFVAHASISIRSNLQAFAGRGWPITRASGFPLVIDVRTEVTRKVTVPWAKLFNDRYYGLAMMG